MARPLVLFALLLAPWAVAASPVATLVLLEGDVTVVRNGQVFASEKVVEGFPIEGFDTVSTGATGKAEVRFVSATGLTGTLRLDPATSLYLDLSSLKDQQTAGVELLAGSVTVRLTALAGGSGAEVRTELGTFGGAARVFRVVVAPAGDVLVSAAAGKVACRVEGRTVFIEPGSVAEALALDRSVRTFRVNASTVASAEASWSAQRRQEFRDRAAVYFKALAGRYQLEASRFQRAWERTQRETNEAGAPGAVANLRRAAFPLERSLFRVAALKQLLDEGVLDPAVELNRGYTARDFFRQAGQDQASWSGRLAQARALYRQQADQHGGEFPKASEGLDISYGSAFFH